MAWKGHTWHRVDALYLGGLLWVAVLFMWPAWSQPDGLWYPPKAAYSDLTVTHWPNMWFVAQTVREVGEIPLWRPLIMGGAPFVGNPLSALFYPPNWLFTLLPVTLTFHLLFALHLYGAGAALYGLARWSYRCSPFAAFVAGLGYMLTPKVIAHIGAGHVGLSQAFAWLPLTMWLLRSAIGRRSSYRAAWCGAALAVSYMADPRIAFYNGLLLAGYALYRLVDAWRGATWRAARSLAWRVLLVPLVFALVGAVQMYPTLELMATTSRADLSLSEAARDSLPWRYLFGYLVADRGGYHEWMTYLGLLPLGAAIWALWGSQERERWFWAGLAGVSLTFSLGTHGPLYPLLYRLLPGLRWLRVPPRALLLLALAANLLAALGVDALLGHTWSPQGRRWATLGGVAGLVLSAGLGFGFQWMLGGDVPPEIVAFAALGAALMGVFLVTVRRWLPAVAIQAVLGALLLVDLWPVGRSLAGLRPAEQVFAEGAVPAAYLAAQPGRFRVYSPSYSIPQHVGARMGLEQLDGVDPSQLRWLVRFMGLAGGYEVPGYGVTIPHFPDGGDVRTALQGATPDAALLGMLNARFVVAEFPISAPDLILRSREGSSYMYENQRLLPRAYTVSRVEQVGGWEEAQERLGAGTDPAHSALVEGGPALEGPPGLGAASVRRFSPNRVVVEAEVSEPSLLVLSEVWYPGWQVTVDGVRQISYRVNGILRGVYLDPGAHVVTWQYRPASLRWGALVTLVTLATLVLGRMVWRTP